MNDNGRSYWESTPNLKARYFYQLGAYLGNAICFPALGYRLYTFSVYNFGTDGYYWTADITSSPYNLRFTSDNVSPANGVGVNNALLVRPVSD